MKSSDSQSSSGTLNDAVPLACTNFAASTRQQASPRGAPMLPSYPMMMTPQGPVPALMMNPGMLMHPSAKAASGQQTAPNASTLTQASSKQPQVAMQQPYVTFTPMLSTKNGKPTFVLPDNGKAAQAKAGASPQGSAPVQFQPQQWGMVPTTMPNGQLMYVMVPMSHLRAAGTNSAPASNPTSQASSSFMQPMSIQLIPSVRATSSAPTSISAASPIKPAPTSTASQTPPLPNPPPTVPTAAMNPCPAVAPEPIIRSPYMSDTSTTTAAAPALRIHSQATSAHIAPCPKVEEPTLADPAISCFDDWGDADMLRVFLGEEESQDVWSPPQDNADGLDDMLFNDFEERREEQLDLSFGSGNWDQLDPPSDLTLSTDFSGDSQRTMDDSGSGRFSHGSGNSCPARPKRASSKADSRLKPIRAGVTKVASGRSTPKPDIDLSLFLGFSDNDAAA